jgi:hypothetical protein
VYSQRLRDPGASAARTAAAGSGTILAGLGSRSELLPIHLQPCGRCRKMSARALSGPGAARTSIIAGERRVAGLPNSSRISAGSRFAAPGRATSLASSPGQRVGAGPARLAPARDRIRAVGKRPTSKNGLAFARGFRSAFDMSGMGLLRDGLFSPPAWKSVDAYGAVALDRGRVMSQLGRSYACAQRALEEGVAIEQLPLGCTSTETTERRPPTRHRSASRAAVKR